MLMSTTYGSTGSHCSLHVLDFKVDTYLRGSKVDTATLNKNDPVSQFKNVSISIQKQNVISYNWVHYK